MKRYNPYLVAFVGIAFGLSIGSDGNTGIAIALFLALGILTGFFRSVANVFTTEQAKADK